FHRGDPYRTVLPRTLCGRLDVTIDLLVTPPFKPNEVTLPSLPQQSQVLDCHHSPVTDEDHSPQAEAFLQIFEHHLNTCRIAQTAIEDMMGNGPAVDHHQTHLHLTVARLAIATVSKAGQTHGRRGPQNRCLSGHRRPSRPAGGTDHATEQKVRPRY